MGDDCSHNVGLGMSADGILESTLVEILQVIQPLRSDWNLRLRILHELRSVAESVDSLRGATVEPFGSFLSNLFTRWGDMDISIEVPNGTFIAFLGKKRKLSLLADLQAALRRAGGIRRLQLIAHARVPILKFESNYHNISCDISINNLQGQMKSKYLYWISDIDGRFRSMVLLVKEWAKAIDINDSKTGTLSSFSLCLLVIFHLQTCVPAILPPLKEIYPGNMVEDLTGERAVAERQIYDVCAANITKFKSGSRKVNQASLSQLFISFLEKFSDIDVKASTQGICPFTGQWEDLQGNMRWLPKTYALFIEDPLEQPENSARAVSTRQLSRISKAFEATHKRLTMNLERTALVTTLLRPQIAQYIPGIQLTFPSNYIGSHHSTRPWGQNGSVSSKIHRSRNAKPQNRPNNMNGQNSAQTVQTQGQQQIWIPKPKIGSSNELKIIPHWTTEAYG
ncbi:hypothetical protein RJ641_036022 [Dillenia turbinata]|uniref:Poly(A) RNA polymerase mitochondrial-like central palm domain-containing protein n=1 Tax=Dillenia turbinata TaxID=194707 RepID=A0AAN8VDN5_9MAGN